jgi:hypothetical protein
MNLSSELARDYLHSKHSTTVTSLKSHLQSLFENPENDLENTSLVLRLLVQLAARSQYLISPALDFYAQELRDRLVDRIQQGDPRASLTRLSALYLIVLYRVNGESNEHTIIFRIISL